MKKTNKTLKKEQSKNLKILVTILSISLIIMIYFIQQNKMYQEENNKLAQLRKEYIALERQNDLYIALKDNYLDIIEEEKQLGTNKKTIEEQINDLNKEITTLKKQIEETNKKIKAIS